jgi:hypothetical protein
MVTAVQKHYYGYGIVIDVRESLRDSCVLGSEEKGRSDVTVVMNSFATGLIEFRRVLNSY